MAQDYDSPRSKDEDEESLQALGKMTTRTPSPRITSCRVRI